MNILFISNVLPRNYIGLSWSVPARVIAQMKYDNVLWINSNENTLSHWHNVPCFHKLDEFGKLSLNNFPKPFQRPDIVVFEGFYDDIHEVFFSMQLKRNNIPYIIVPRSALTIQAYNNHAWLKKRIAHFFLYNRFIKNSTAIQYLTKQEQKDSEKTFNHRSFVLPNGFETPDCSKTSFSKNAIRAIFIGRLSTYQKGLDILIPALGIIAKKLELANFSLDIYGPFHQETEDIKRMILDNKLQNIIKLKGEIQGNDKKKALLESDLFVLTSRFEGHPMGLIEALAYGLPCFITPGTNMKAEVDEYNAGWTTELSEKAISDTILEVIQQRDLLEEKSKKAKELAANYNWNKIAAKFHEITLELIS